MTDERRADVAIVYRSQCQCPCHDPNVTLLHIVPCCYPDPLPATDAEIADVFRRLGWHAETCNEAWAAIAAPADDAGEEMRFRFVVDGKLVASMLGMRAMIESEPKRRTRET